MVKKKTSVKNFLLLSLLIIFGLIIFIFLFLNYDFVKIMVDTVYNYYNSFGELGVYLGIFLISIFGNFTIIFPVPYLIAVMTVILLLPVNFWIVGIAAGLGASIGELTAWIIGRGVRKLAMDKNIFTKNIKLLEKLVHKGYAFILIIIFAATPLPDDVLLILLGTIKYPLLLALLATFIGKLIMTFALGLIVEFSTLTPISSLILNFYNINVVDGVITGSQNPLIGNSFIVVTIILLFLLFKMDWSRFLKAKK